MTWRVRTTMAAALAVVCLTSSGVAQERPADTMDVLREKVRADKKLVVAVALDLSESEAKSFWPIYGGYQSDMITHHDRVAKLLGDYAKAYPTISDEAAAQLLREFLALESDHAALLTRWAPRFQQVLPPRKVARFYQVENKIRALLSYELARDIPLVK